MIYAKVKQDGESFVTVCETRGNSETVGSRRPPRHSCVTRASNQPAANRQKSLSNLVHRMENKVFMKDTF